MTSERQLRSASKDATSPIDSIPSQGNVKNKNAPHTKEKPSIPEPRVEPRPAGTGKKPGSSEDTVLGMKRTTKIKNIIKRVLKLTQDDVLHAKEEIAKDLKDLLNNTEEVYIAASSAGDSTLQQLRLFEATPLELGTIRPEDMKAGTDAYHRGAEKARVFVPLDQRKESAHRTHIELVLLDTMLLASLDILREPKERVALFFEVEGTASGVSTADGKAVFRITAKADYLMVVMPKGHTTQILPQQFASSEFWELFSKCPVLLIEAKSEMTIGASLPQTVVESIVFQILANQHMVTNGQLRFILASGETYYFGAVEVNDGTPKGYWVTPGFSLKSICDITYSDLTGKESSEGYLANCLKRNELLTYVHDWFVTYNGSALSSKFINLKARKKI